MLLARLRREPVEGNKKARFEPGFFIEELKKLSHLKRNDILQCRLYFCFSESAPAADWAILQARVNSAGFF